MIENKNNKDNHILSIVWLIFLIFPNNQTFFIFVPIAYIYLFNFKLKIGKDVIHCVLILAAWICLSFLFNINELYISYKSISRAAVLIVLFLTFGRLRGMRILAPYIYFGLAFLIIFQLSPILNITPLNSIVNTYYNSTEDTGVLSTFSSFDYNYRLGGIYINPNNYASYLELILVVMLCEIKQFNRKILIILLSVIVFSLIASGSRTSLIVFGIIGLYYLYVSGVISLKKALLITFAIGIVSVSFLMYGQITDLRALKVDEGLDNSFGAKVQILENYLNTNPPFLKLTFGNFSEDALQNYLNIDFNGMDFEFGNAILYYGVIFLFLIVLFYYKIFRHMSPKYRVVFIILLWMFSNSILLSYRMSAVWILILGLYYRRSISEKRIINRYDKKSILRRIL